MRAFTTHSGFAAVLNRHDVDTDQVISKEVDDSRRHMLLNGLDDIGLTSGTKTKSRRTSGGGGTA